VQIVEQAIPIEVMRILGQRQMWTVPWWFVMLMMTITIAHCSCAIVGMVTADVQVIDLLLNDLLVLFKVCVVETFRRIQIAD
jgi:hypothetical protein